MKRKHFKTAGVFILMCLCISFVCVGQTVKPKYVYLSNMSQLVAGEKVTGPARILDLKNRKGINPTSINTTIELGKHTLNASQGTAVFWFFSLEDLGSSFITDNMKIHNPYMAYYAFLSDYPVPREMVNANFFFGWTRESELRAQFFKGELHPTAFDPPQKAFVQAVPFNYFDKYQWYQVSFTWDDKKKDMRLYVNGILVGTSDRFNQDFYREKVNPVLYAGAPAICYGEIRFYDSVLSESDIYNDYKLSATDYNPQVEKDFRHIFEGADLKDFTFKLDVNWLKKMDVSFKNPADIKDFYIQGQVDAVKPTGHPEGLLIETPQVSFEKKNRDKQMYIWSNQIFEGNLYVEFEWMALKPNGLAHLMVYASGMAREKFMEDYPKRTTGQMWMVYKEDVRSYHWEFYREMHDVRNDVGTSFSRKNPFFFRNGFGSYDRPYELNKWHKAQLVIINGKAQAAIDGKIIMEFTDSSRANNGCILNVGNIALRVMLNSKMVFRNLKVYTEKLPFTEEGLYNDKK